MSLKLMPPTATSTASANGPIDRSKPVARNTRPARKSATRMISISLLVVASLLCLWTVIFRVPRLRQPIPVRARAVEHPLAHLVDSHELETMKERSRQLRANLFAGRQVVLNAIHQFETAAESTGWRIQTTLEHPLPTPSAGPGVERLPVSVVLRDRLGDTTDQSALDRLATVIDSLNLRQRRIDIVRLQAIGGRAGLAEVQMEIQFWLVHQDEKTAAE